MKAPICCKKRMTAFAIDTNSYDNTHVYFQCKKCKDVDIKDVGEYPSIYEADESEEEDE